MKKLFVLCFLVIASICFAELSDVAATGKYAGYRKLMGHEYEGKVDLYFKASYNSEKQIASQDMKIVPLYKNVNLKEKVTLKIPNGERRIATKQDWFIIFRKLEDFNSQDSDHFRKNYPKLYKEFSDGEAFEADRIIKKYIENVYLPNKYPNYPKPINRFSPAVIPK